LVLFAGARRPWLAQTKKPVCCAKKTSSCFARVFFFRGPVGRPPPGPNRQLSPLPCFSIFSRRPPVVPAPAPWPKFPLFFFLFRRFSFSRPISPAALFVDPAGAGPPPGRPGELPSPHPRNNSKRRKSRLGGPRFLQAPPPGFPDPLKKVALGARGSPPQKNTPQVSIFPIRAPLSPLPPPQVFIRPLTNLPAKRHFPFVFFFVEHGNSGQNMVGRRGSWAPPFRIVVFFFSVKKPSQCYCLVFGVFPHLTISIIARLPNRLFFVSIPGYCAYLYYPILFFLFFIILSDCFSHVFYTLSVAPHPWWGDR